MRRSWVTLLTGLLALAVVSSPARAQSTLHRVFGVVADSTGAGVENAAIVVMDVAGGRHAALSDSAGRFSFVSVARGRASVSVRRLGFHPYAKIIDAGASALSDSLAITLMSVASALSAVDVIETAGGAPAEFYERRKTNHFGRFIDRVVLDRAASETVSDNLRGMAGVTVQPSNRMGNSVRVRGCRPTVWMNGMRVKGAEIDEVTVTSDVAAMEVYNSRAGLPIQYVDRDNPCGAILIWSRG